MRRQLLPIVPLAVIAVVFFQVYSGWFGESADADIADGTYEIDYEMIEADNDNTSIADGYFTKPAKLIVENGTKYIQLTVTGADMIKSLSAPSGPVEVISEDESEDTRTVKFRVDEDLTEPVEMEMHVVVPDLYDTTHTARAVFDVDDLETAPSEDRADENANTEGGDESIENDTGDESEALTSESEKEAKTAAKATSSEDSASNTMWMVLVIIGVLIVIGVGFWMFRSKKNIK